MYANKAFKNLTGYSPDEVLGKTPKMLQGPATDKKVIARLANTLKKGGRFEGKAINYKKDGITHYRSLCSTCAKIKARRKSRKFKGYVKKETCEKFEEYSSKQCKDSCS